ncbi:MAG: hypothetical protein MI861_15110, partial [Pirellulales bacterium]|nr:hypothetical protein [Pirellulales bacterium]
MRKNCLACHSASEKQGNLVLESAQGMLAGGDTGPAVIAGRSEDSLLLALAAHQDEPVMPPQDNEVAAKNLTAAELELLKLWIDQGAKSSGGAETLSPRQWLPLPPGTHPVQAVALTADGQLLACGRANQIFLYHVPTGQLITKLADASLDTDQMTGVAHRDLIQSLAFNAAGNLLASGGFREVKLWRRPRDVQRLQLAIHSAATAIAVSPDQNWLAVADKNHSIHLFRTSDGGRGPTCQGHRDTITSLCFDPNGNALFSGSLDGSIRGWKLDGQPLGRIQAPAAINAIEFVRRSPTQGAESTPQ